MNVRIIEALLAAIGLVGGCSAGSGTPSQTVTRTVTETATATASSRSTPAPVTDYRPPKPHPRDFRIALRIKSKSCFGSAGCNIEYQINPQYVGTGDISTGRYEITYAVRGGDSGPQINTFTITNGRASFDSRELLSTPPNPHLTARVLSVQRA